MIGHHDDAMDDALARAVVYRALSIGFQAPTDEGLDQIGAYERFAIVAAALQRLDRQSHQGRLTAVGTRLTSLVAPSADGLAATFVRLFGHTTRGPICACETEYDADNSFYQPQQLADISGYYLAFGLRPVAGSDARADHVACECEFMDFLNRKEALLLTARSGDDETLEATRGAARTFLRDHLSRFGRAFATRVMIEDPEGFFGVLGRTLIELLDVECRRLNIEAGPIDLVVRPDVADEAPMACGAGPELIQIQQRP